jgi:predicted Zn-dependent protease
MKAPVAGVDERRFELVVDEATDRLSQRVSGLSLSIETFTFEGSPLDARGSRFKPLDYLEIGLAEKLERKTNFLLIVTHAEMEAGRTPYVVAYPSRLANVGMISVRRLLPDFWGGPQDDELAVNRLVSLMLHTLGHILNLDHTESSTNVMYDFASVEALDRMTHMSAVQTEQMRQNLETEAHDERARGSSISFWWRHVWGNLGVIGGTLGRANPLRLMSKLPTFLTAALSVVAVLFFSAEVWDVADTVEAYQVGLFVALAIGVATFVLYRTFGFGTLLDREHLVSESTVVVQTTTFVAVMITVLTIFLFFFVLTFVAAVTIFPRELMSEWTSTGAANDAVDHFKLSLFLASMAVLTGSLGGRIDSKRLVRTVLFLDEGT